MEINVREGTVDQGRQSLCETCRWSTIIRGKRLAEKIVECVQLTDGHRRVPFVVADCSDYADRTRLSLREMQEIALILRATPRTNPVGYTRGDD